MKERKNVAGEEKKSEIWAVRRRGVPRRAVRVEEGGKKMLNTPKNVEHAQKMLNTPKNHTQQPQNRRTHPTNARTHLTKHAKTPKHKFWPNSPLSKCGQNNETPFWAKCGLAKCGHKKQLAKCGFFWPNAVLAKCGLAKCGYDRGGGERRGGQLIPLNPPVTLVRDTKKTVELADFSSHTDQRRNRHRLAFASCYWRFRDTLSPVPPFFDQSL